MSKNKHDKVAGDKAPRDKHVATEFLNFLFSAKDWGNQKPVTV